MSKIIVRRQEYANNGTHADEIEAVVQENLIANTLSSATDIAPSVGLLKTVNDSLKNLIVYKSYSFPYSLNAGAALSVTGTDLGVSNPTGYVVLGFRQINTGSDTVVARIIAPQNSGASTVIRLVNVGTTNVVNISTVIDILYIRSLALGTG